VSRTQCMRRTVRTLAERKPDELVTEPATRRATYPATEPATKGGEPHVDPRCLDRNRLGPSHLNPNRLDLSLRFTQRSGLGSPERPGLEDPDAVVITNYEKVLVACHDTAASARNRRREHPVVIRITADGCRQRRGFHNLRLAAQERFGAFYPLIRDSELPRQVAPELPQQELREHDLMLSDTMFQEVVAQPV